MATNRKFIPEMLDEINKDPKTIESYIGNGALTLVFQYAFLPTKKFCLPEGAPPYKQDAAPIGMSSSNLMMELRRLYVFTPERELGKVRREQLFIQLLETLHPSEAALLIAIKDQTLDKLYKNIKVDLLIDNGFLPEELRVKKAKSGATSRKKS
jgi:hypothetical protein